MPDHSTHDLESLERLSTIRVLDALDAERLLDLRAAVLARAVDGAGVGRERADLVALEIGGSRFAVPSLFVSDVRETGKLAPLPGAAPHLRGVVVFRGALIGVLDLARVFGGDGARAEPARLVVVSHDEGRLALACDVLHGLRPLATGELSAPPAPADARTAELVRGVDQEGFAVLDVPKLFGWLAA